MTILVEWLRNPVNYSRWKGGDGHNGQTKESLCTEIRQLFIANGITNRDNRHVRNKIEWIHDKFKAANEWLKQTGQGVRDDYVEEGLPADVIATRIEGKV